MILVLQLLAVVFLVLAALGVNAGRVNLGWAGLALWAALVFFG